MKTVALCSLMRAGSDFERAYYHQVLALAQWTYRIHSVNLIYDAEPSGSASLRALLNQNGIPAFYEIEAGSDQRFETFGEKIAHWAAIANQCLDLALRTGEHLTHVAWVEADLSFPYDTLDILLQRNRPIIAPLIYLGNWFYDSWGFRDQTGAKLYSFPPSNPRHANEPVEMHSVGSFVLFEIGVFRAGIRFRADYEHGLLVGICEDAAKLGMRTFADPNVSVLHPVTAWKEQMWTCTRIVGFLDGECRLDKPLLEPFPGPYEELIRPWLDHVFYGATTGPADRRVSIRRVPAARTFEVDVFFTTAKS